MNAPICLFIYNRLNETRQTLEALRRNYLASESDLYIFSDGAKNELDALKITAVRQYIHTVSGFKSIEIKEASKNKGLASSIISGVSQILEKHEKIIVLEDDLITSPNFIKFMNEALFFYNDEIRIQSICAYSLSLKNKSNDVYFQMRTGSWGWATWSNRWNPDIFNKDNLRALLLSEPHLLKEFQRKCGADMHKMLLDSIYNRNDSWYVRWTFDHFRNNHFAVFPSYSFVNNIGHSAGATHTKGINSYMSESVDEHKMEFHFIPFQPTDRQSGKEFLHYFSKRYKLVYRIKLLKTLSGRKQILDEIKTRLGIN